MAASGFARILATRNQRNGDQATRTESSDGNASGGVRRALGGVGQSLIMPNLKRVASAVAEENPLLGQTAKAAGAVGGAVVRRRKEKNLQRTQQSQDSSGELSDDIQPHLESINSELTRITGMFSTQVENTDETSDGIGDLVRIEEDIRDDQRSSAEQAEADRLEARRLQQESGGGVSRRVDTSGGDSGGGSGGIGGMLAGIIGGAGGGGLLAGLGAFIKFFKPIASIGMKLLKFVGGGVFKGLKGMLKIFKPLMSVGPKLLKLGLKATGIGAILLGIYDFVSGFFSAGEILDKEEGDVTITDRIAAGVASLTNGFLGIIDWFTETVFGFSFLPEDFEGDFAKLLAGFFSGIVDSIKGIVDSVVGFVSDIFSMDNIPSLSDIGKFVSEKVDSFVADVKSFIPDLLGDVAGGVKNFFGFGDDEEEEEEDGKISEERRKEIKRQDEARRKMLANMTDEERAAYEKETKAAMEDAFGGIVDFGKDVGKSIASFFGGGDDEESDKVSDAMKNGDRVMEEKNGEKAGAGGGGANIISAPSSTVHHSSVSVQASGNTGNPDRDVQEASGKALLSSYAK